MKRIMIPIGMLLATQPLHAQLTPTENYIQSSTYLEPVTTSGASARKMETVQYFDGLGRPKQVVNVKASPLGRDVVTHFEYDGFGRQVKDYLPIPQGGTLNGAFIPNPLGNASSVYGGEKVYSEKTLESSPLNRVLQQVQVGNDWSNRPVKFEYGVNGSDDLVRQYRTTTTWHATERMTVSGLELPGYFPASQLSKTTVTDEDGNKTIEFKNGKGQTILVRKVLNATDNADTYYIYNEYDQLAFVAPPLVSTWSTLDDVTKDRLFYQYRYDGKGRLVEKKLPGKGWEYMVYDKADRLVLTQDANLRTKGQWLFTKYDRLSRPIYTGLLDSPPGRIQQATVVEQQGVNSEERSTSGWNNGGMDVFYTTGNAYPGTNFKVLSVNYYDDYPQGYGFNPPFPTVIQGAATLTGTPNPDGKSTKGLPVLNLMKNIEDDNWTRSYTYYDGKGRAVGTHTINHLGGYTRTESELDFTGIPKQTITRHKMLDADVERTIKETFEYDNQNRLLVHRHQVDSNPVEILAQNSYNELSQVETKKVGGVALGSPLQQMDYRYNIRGWMTKVNDPANLNGRLFGYELRYTNPVYAAKSPGKFNGNIAEVDWRNSTEDILKRYNYEYDALNRLRNGFYAEPDAINPHNGNFDEYLAYDLAGNITNLKRRAIPVSGLTSTIVDDLAYQYTGNRLDKVIENAMNDTGYEGGNNPIAYDLNGNMTDMRDKGIESITYNHLNLPNGMGIKVTNGAGNVGTTDISHLYRADGTKLRKRFLQQGYMGLPFERMTDYLDGFQYTYTNDGSSCRTCRTEVAYEEQAYMKAVDPGASRPQWRLDFVPTSEGFYSFTENRYIYQYRDHLGNARVSFAKNGAGALEVTDTNNYYPFGLNHIGATGSGTSKIGTYFSYKYNGKELQETGMYDYGARMYMPDLGRWGVVDPLAEKSRRFSTYTYALDNPIMFIDPDGREAERCCSWSDVKNFGIGVKNGFVGSVKGAADFLQHPINNTAAAVRNYTWKNYAESTANSLTMGAYGYAKGTMELMQGDAKNAGKMVGQKAAEVAIGLATDGALKGIKSITKKINTTATVNAESNVFSNVGKVEQLAQDRNIMSLQNGLREKEVVSQILDTMKSPDGLDVSKYTIGGYYSEGTYYISEGNHRMAAALEYQVQTGDSKYVTEFLKTGTWRSKTPSVKTYKFTVNTD